MLSIALLLLCDSVDSNVAICCFGEKIMHLCCPRAHNFHKNPFVERSPSRMLWAFPHSRSLSIQCVNISCSLFHFLSRYTHTMSIIRIHHESNLNEIYTRMPCNSLPFHSGYIADNRNQVIIAWNCEWTRYHDFMFFFFLFFFLLRLSLD